jgi:hypothetical protein
MRRWVECRTWTLPLRPIWDPFRSPCATNQKRVAGRAANSGSQCHQVGEYTSILSSSQNINLPASESVLDA